MDCIILLLDKMSFDGSKIMVRLYIIKYEHKHSNIRFCGFALLAETIEPAVYMSFNDRV